MIHINPRILVVAIFCYIAAGVTPCYAMPTLLPTLNGNSSETSKGETFPDSIFHPSNSNGNSNSNSNSNKDTNKTSSPLLNIFNSTITNPQAFLEKVQAYKEKVKAVGYNVYGDTPEQEKIQDKAEKIANLRGYIKAINYGLVGILAFFIIFLLILQWGKLAIYAENPTKRAEVSQGILKLILCISILTANATIIHILMILSSEIF